ncbi:MAG TPA: FtsK/SpoIIIE domain-containing protein [Pseudonocardiaceae bacterium]|nr:FtsK/SpoIIIE domain-containing protein [Pseudonocardiaceae bacterium]
MSKRNERRKRIEATLAEFRVAVGQALGVAAGQQGGVATEHARTMVELWLRTDGLDAANADPALRSTLASSVMADVVAKVAADQRQHFMAWNSSGPLALTELVTRCAPGAAGEPWQTWLGRIGTADGTGALPELWRIGTAVADQAPERVPFPVAVPLLDSAHVQVSTTPETRAAGEALVEALLLRVLSYLQPGLAHVHVWDTGQLTGSLPGLYPLTRAGLLTVHDPARPEELLDELSEHVRRVHTGVLAGGDTSIGAVSGRAGRRTEPWRLAVLFGDRQALKNDLQQRLQRIARNGLPAGVQLIVVDVPLTVNSPMETVTFIDEHVARCSMSGPVATFTPDEPLPRAAVPGACAVIAEDLQGRRSRVCTFADLLPEPLWQQRSAAGLGATIGWHEELPVDVVLGDSSPHALVGGPSGSGKTNFLYMLLGGLAARYSPDELELYLLDFKEGVSFAQFAPGRRDPSWLPHARLVGVNVNADREFGVALLKFLADTMRYRADAAKQYEVTKLEELRAEDPGGRWPRIVAVIDEFQYLFAERDAVATNAARLLEDVARRGRSQGIHLVLASQDVSGIEAFWGKPAIFEQFILRIALPKARRVLVELNDAAVELPRWHAVVNHESGVRHGNQTARIPDATSRGTFDELQRRLFRLGTSLPPPRLFDGSHVPALADTPDYRALRPRPGVPSALLGQIIDVAGSAAATTLSGAPGSNLAVIGSTVAEAASVLGAAALSVARQHIPDAARFTLCPLVGDATAPVAELAQRLRLAGHDVDVIERDELRMLIAELALTLTAARSGAAADVFRPHYVFCYGVDAAHALLEAKDPAMPVSGLEHLRTVLRHGPEHHTHVFGWWRGVGRLKASLPIGSVEDIGPWVAFDVQGQELSVLAPGQVIPWSPRPGRGLFFDRFADSRPQVIIPFDIDKDIVDGTT